MVELMLAVLFHPDQRYAPARVPVLRFDSSEHAGFEGAGNQAVLSRPAAFSSRDPRATSLGIAFLSRYGVPPAELIAASRRAQAEGVSADWALLANGFVEEKFFYKCLADHLGLLFIDEPVRLDLTGDYAQAIHAGLAPIAGHTRRAWLNAPRGKHLAALLRDAKHDGDLRSRLAIATPAHLSRCVREAARSRMSAEASFGLLSTNADFTAKSGSNFFQQACAGAGALLFAASFMLTPAIAAKLWALMANLLFFTAILFRLLVAAAALGAPSLRVKRLTNHELPVYTIVVALYREAGIGKQLINRLNCLDYPRAKLDIKLVIEEDDDETRRALETLPLAPVYEIIIAPAGDPRTKPRALNIALPIACGSLIAVYDAEDEPDPGQIRLAAERFAASPPHLACLQARLAIDNIDDSWLTRLFAIEYAALFNLQNVGLADLGLPLPLGGSSNHFRTAVLREIHGWDAWNVTEDADVGLRLARFGYAAGVLNSTTREEAPASLPAWLGQRRRWFKGWMQTFVTLSRNPVQLMRDIGLMRSGGVALLFLCFVFGPLFWLPANFLITLHLVRGGFGTSASLPGLCFTTLWASVNIFGVGSLIWQAIAGMKRQKLLYLWPALPLLLPYYTLHSVAAWMAVLDLFRRPFHWQKTEHGLARTSASRPSMKERQRQEHPNVSALVRYQKMRK